MFTNFTFGFQRASKRASSSALSAAVIAALTCVSALALAGCGGGGGDTTFENGANAGSPPGSAALVEDEAFVGTISNTRGASVPAGAIQINGVSSSRITQGALAMAVLTSSAVTAKRYGLRVATAGATQGVELSPKGDDVFFSEIGDTLNRFSITSGKVRVVTASGNTLVLRFENVVLARTKGAAGSFTLNGTFATKKATIQ